MIFFARGRSPHAELAQATATATATPSAASLPTGKHVEASLPTESLDAHGCSIEDHGNGDLVSAAGPGHFKVWVAPAALRPDGGYDLVLHFHGGEAIRKILAPVTHDLVFATLDRGDSSGDYAGTFPDRRAWDDAIHGIDHAVGQALGAEAHADRIALSSWSAGYDAVGEALGVASADVSGVILLDSLYASYEGTGNARHPAAVPRFLAAAKRSLEGDHFTFALTHSEILPPGYASTAEVADALLAELFVRSERVERSDPNGMSLSRIAGERGFVLRGYKGNDAAAHCGHLRLLPELLDVWRAHR